MFIQPERALEPGKLAAFFLPLIEQRQQLRKHIEGRLPYIMNLARSNFELESRTQS